LKRYSIIYITLITLLFSGYARSQDVLTQMQNGEDVNVVFKDMAVGGIFIHTEGWGLFFRRAKILTIHRKWFWEIETATMHSDKEHKIQNASYPDATAYYFGKLNGMQAFRAGTGFYTMLWRKNNERCVEVDALYAVGISLAVLKPVYLQIIQPTPSPDTFILSSEEYNPLTDTPENIYGRASVFDGLGQLTFYPGAYARAGLNFDYANRHNTVKSIETGLELDAFLQNVPIMAPEYTSNSQFFLNLYVNINFGKRWF
jgi:hypothetical protein